MVAMELNMEKLLDVFQKFRMGEESKKIKNVGARYVHGPSPTTKNTGEQEKKSRHRGSSSGVGFQHSENIRELMVYPVRSKKYESNMHE